MLAKKIKSVSCRIKYWKQADEEFSERVQNYLAKVGLAIPPISRLEARATSSRTTTGNGSSSTRGYISTSASSRGAGGGYRQVGGHASDSQVVFETVGAGPTNGNQRAKTALPVNWLTL